MPLSPWLIPPIPAGATNRTRPQPITHLPELKLDGTIIAVSGDWQRDREWALTQLRAAHQGGATALIQLGDFGIFWPEDSDRDFERDIMWELEKLNMTLIFVDGNNDNHPKLHQLGANQGQRTRNGLVSVLPRIWWATRGSRFLAGGRSFAALGGAHSLETPHLKPWVNWWPGLEEPKTRDLMVLGNGHSDVFLTHEAPAGIDYQLPTTQSRKHELASAQVKQIIREGMEAVKPQLVFHGHHHIRATSTLTYGDGQTTVVQALSRNRRAYCTVLLDTVTMTVTDH